MNYQHMKARIRFKTKEELREYLNEIGVPEHTFGRIDTDATFGEFTEAQLELARNAFNAEIEED
ncbi:hypothetical protein GCM10028786_32190 [Flaviaesturariibacter terrae]